jgi:hypothetical protein
VADARAWALAKVGARQYRCLAEIVRRESGWSSSARNRRSGAYGLAQAMHPEIAYASFGADWRGNPVVQIRFAVAYAARRYGDACHALAFHDRWGWW